LTSLCSSVTDFDEVSYWGHTWKVMGGGKFNSSLYVSSKSKCITKKCCYPIGYALPFNCYCKCTINFAAVRFSLLWQSPTLHSWCRINKGLIKRGSTIDHWRSWCNSWILWPAPYTYIHTLLWILLLKLVSLLFFHFHWK
jgi:hypothetical protein